MLNYSQVLCLFFQTNFNCFVPYLFPGATLPFGDRTPKPSPSVSVEHVPQTSSATRKSPSSLVPPGFDLSPRPSISASPRPSFCLTPPSDDLKYYTPEPRRRVSLAQGVQFQLSEWGSNLSLNRLLTECPTCGHGKSQRKSQETITVTHTTV